MIGIAIPTAAWIVPNQRLMPLYIAIGLANLWFAAKILRQGRS
jgi:hypothetical protein